MADPERIAPTALLLLVRVNEEIQVRVKEEF
jgi:hypothetical protein